MPDADGALNGLAAVNQAAEIGKSAFGLGDLERAVRRHADTGRVIASVLQLGQSVQQNGRCLLLSDVAYDSTHIM